MGPWYTADVTLLIVNSRELLYVVTKQMHELTPFQLLFRPTTTKINTLLSDNK